MWYGSLFGTKDLQKIYLFNFISQHKYLKGKSSDKIELSQLLRKFNELREIRSECIDDNRRNKE